MRPPPQDMVTGDSFFFTLLTQAQNCRAKSQHVGLELGSATDVLGKPGSSLSYPLGLGFRVSQTRTVVQHDRDSFHDAVDMGGQRDSQIPTRTQRPLHHVL